MGLKYLCLFFLLPVPALQGQDIRFHPGDSLNPGNGVVEVSGLPPGCLKAWREHPPDWKSILKVFPKALRLEKKDAIPPMLGSYFLTDSVLTFRPRFPFREGQEYVVEFSCVPNDLLKAVDFSVPHSPRQTLTFLEAVYPTAGQVPANLLKMYLYFSGPIGLGNTYEHIHLFDGNGAEIEKPFLELEPALWDKHHQRLTLWFDPGRIKTDLQPNLSRGQPLQAGKCYKLLVSKNLRDAFGQPLAGDFEKNICTAEEDRKKPDPSEWKIVSPRARTQEPLTIRFSESLDKAGLENGIAVLDARDQVIEGKVIISDWETGWTFTPETPWQAGNYQLLLDPRMEDLTGNNLTRLFDTQVEADELEMPGKTEFMIRFKME